jgi:hypothetical protein
MSDKRAHNEYKHRRELQSAGWRVDKTDKIEFNGGEESLRHIECKARVAWYLREQGYRVDSEVVGPDGQELDIAAYGLSDEPPFGVECVTGLTEDVTEQKLEQFYHNTPFAECYLLEVTEMPDTPADAIDWIQDRLGGSL